MGRVDYYQLLGVERGASIAEIKSAYRVLAKRTHPDMGGSPAAFQLLREAYETLTDPVRRTAHDLRDAPVGASAYPADADRVTRPSQSWVAEPAPPRQHRTSPPRTEPKAASYTPPPKATRPTPRPNRSDPAEESAFQPTLPRLNTRHVPWWRTVNIAERVRYLPAIGPSRMSLAGAAGGCAVLALPVIFQVGLGSPVFFCWIVLFAVVLMVTIRLVRRWLWAVRADQAFAEEFGGRTVFGRPGREPDQLAERLTAKLLSEYLLWLPGARIFHGLAYPGSRLADIDHAVLCGHRLVLIESKLWLPGHYRADESGALWRNDHPFRGGSVRLPDGMAAYHELLPDLEIRAALVLYPSRAGVITTAASPNVAIPPMTPERFVVEIGAWLAAESACVDRDIFRTVLDRVAGAT